jgi:hypothetical protein
MFCLCLSGHPEESLDNATSITAEQETRWIPEARNSCHSLKESELDGFEPTKLPTPFGILNY